MRHFLAALVALVALAGCSPAVDAGAAPRSDRVVLVTIDGVRWQDIAAAGAPARLPALYRLVDRGVAIVDDLRTSASWPVSLPGYCEILTGRSSACASNDCAPIDEPTLLDEIAAAGDEAGEVASWEGLARAASASARVAVSAGRHGGAGRARIAVDAAGARLLDAAAERHDFVDHPDYRRDADTIDLALRYLEVARPRMLHVALGDTDVHAHAGDVAGYHAALAAADTFLTRVDAVLARLGGKSIVVVTADHGRAASFRDHGRRGDGSERVWLVAAGAGVPARGLVRPLTPHRLADIAPTLRALLALPRDESPRAGVVIDELVAW